MPKRILTQKCLRTALTIQNTSGRQRRIYGPCVIRRYLSPAPAEQPVERPPQSEIKTSPKPRRSREVLPQDLLPFDPPPRRPQRKPAIVRLPERDKPLVDTVNPPKDQGPIPLRIRKPFPVNQSWDLLHQFYAGLFGFEDYIEKGYLTKLLAWQSITHRSYNHGVDPYNEKLAHLGKRAIRMITATHILTLPADSLPLNNLNVNALSKPAMADVMDWHLIGEMGLRYGVAEIMRWKPAFNENLEKSGIRSVAGECMCAVAGAVTLAKGTVHARAFIVNRYLQLLMHNQQDEKTEKETEE